MSHDRPESAVFTSSLSPNSDIGILSLDSFKTGFYVYGNRLFCREVLLPLCFREEAAAHVNMREHVCACGRSESLPVYKLEVTAKFLLK